MGLKMLLIGNSGLAGQFAVVGSGDVIFKNLHTASQGVEIWIVFALGIYAISILVKQKIHRTFPVAVNFLNE